MKSFIQRFRLVVISAYLLLGYSGIAVSQDSDVEVMKASEEVENRIVSKISTNLDMFLTQEQYKVFATAKIKKFREKVILQGELEKKLTGEEEAANDLAVLPGFQNVEQRQADAKKIDRKEKSNYQFRTKTQLEKVMVRLVVEKSLAPELKKLAFDNTNDVVEKTFGSLGKVETVELELSAKKVADSPWEWLVSYLRDKGSSGLDLLYLFLLSIGFLASLLALLFYYKNKKSGKSGLASAMNSNSDQNKNSELNHALLDELIAFLNSSPLKTRIFLKNLELMDRKVIFYAIKTPSMQDFFQKILTIEQAGRFDKVEQNVNEVFEKVLKDLRRFIELNDKIEQKPFGYVMQLTGEQVVEFLSMEKQRIKTLEILAPYLAQYQIKDITMALSLDEKANFFEALALSHDESHSVIPTKLFSPEKSSLDTRLRAFYETVKSETIVDMAKPEAIELSFLDSDQDCVEVIRKVAAKKGSVPKTYEKYLVSFEDFLGLEMGITKKVLQKVSNEVLTKAFANREIDEKAKSVIGDMRSQLIASMLKRDNNFSKDDVDSAKNEVLKAYRSMI